LLEKKLLFEIVAKVTYLHGIDHVV